MRKLFLLLPILFFAQGVDAASLYMDPSTATLFRGDSVTVAVRLDTDEASGECVNAVDGVITYDDSVVPVDISVGKSILPMWVEAPVINKDKHTITFAGGIPNGYCGRVQGDPNLTNTIVELVFRAPGLQVGSGEPKNLAKIGFADTTAVYLNDGKGTKAQLQTYGANLILNNGIGSEIKDDWKTVVENDNIPPEPFSVALNRESKTASNKFFIEFNTTDKQSGLSHYEVIEETTADSNLFRFGAVTSPWAEARSPYVLKDQSLQSVIRVKAIDKAGNEYIATLVPDAALRTTVIPWQLIILGAGLIAIIIIVVLVVWLLLRRRKTRRAALIAADVAKEGSDTENTDLIIT
jgi:hypothetical protein